MFLVEKPAADFLHRLPEFNAEHESLPADLLDNVGGGDCGLEIIACCEGIVHEVLLLHYLQHGNGRSHCRIVASESGSQHSLHRLELRGNQDAAAREAVCDALAHGDDVGPDSVPLVGEEFSGPSVTALHLVENQHCAVFPADIAELEHEALVRDIDASAALYSLDDHGCNISCADFLLHRFNVVQVTETDLVD